MIINITLQHASLLSYQTDSLLSQFIHSLCSIWYLCTGTLRLYAYIFDMYILYIMYVCLYGCSCLRTYLHMHACSYIHTRIHTYIHTYLLTYVHTYLDTYIHTYTYYTYTYIHTHIYTYKHTLPQYWLC